MAVTTTEVSGLWEREPPFLHLTRPLLLTLLKNTILGPEGRLKPEGGEPEHLQGEISLAPGAGGLRQTELVRLKGWEERRQGADISGIF